MHPAGNAAVAGRCPASGGGHVEHYNNVRLNSATGYITPKDMLAGRQREIHAERDRKLVATGKQTTRSEEGDGKVYERPPEIKRFQPFHSRSGQAWPSSWARQNRST